MSMTQPLLVSSFCFTPSNSEHRSDASYLSDTGPAINGTGFVALVDSADHYTVANLSLVIPHMVAGVGSFLG